MHQKCRTQPFEPPLTEELAASYTSHGTVWHDQGKPRKVTLGAPGAPGASNDLVQAELEI